MKKIMIGTLVLVSSVALYAGAQNTPASVAAPAASGPSATKVPAALNASNAAVTTTSSAAMAAGSNGTSMQSSGMMMTSGGSLDSSKVNMMVVDNAGQSPKVQIDLEAPALLTVYDQNGNMAFTQNLQPGQTTVDTANFPLGNDQLVVTSNQPGVDFNVTQNITVGAPESVSTPTMTPAKKMRPQPAPAIKVAPAPAPKPGSATMPTTAAAPGQVNVPVPATTG